MGRERGGVSCQLGSEEINEADECMRWEARSDSSPVVRIVIQWDSEIMARPHSQSARDRKRLTEYLFWFTTHPTALNIDIEDEIGLVHPALARRWRGIQSPKSKEND